MSQLAFQFDTLRAEVQAIGGIIPRDYQQVAIDKAFSLWNSGTVGVLNRQPTGTGKTVTGSLIARQWLDYGSDYRVLVLAHERQLVHQFAEEIEDILRIQPGVEMASDEVKANKIPKITVASRATLLPRKKKDEYGNEIMASRLEKFDPKRFCWLIIIDEAHRWLWNLPSCKPILEWFAQNPESRRLGLTATPQRSDKKTLGKIFQGVSCDYRFHDLFGGSSAVTDGWAVPYDQRFVTVEGVDFQTLKTVASDYDEHELEEKLTERKTLLSFVKPTIDLVGDKRTLCFSATIKMAQWVAHTINEFKEGAAVSIDGSTPEFKRKQVYAAHQKGDFQFLSVCGLCREGYNDPGIGAVAIYRPTKSKSLKEQMLGRGCRPLRGTVASTMSKEERLSAIANSAKPNCLIIDLVGISGMGESVSAADVLADGLPDEVIKRANKNALDKSGSVDMAEELKKAKAQIDEERESENRKRARMEAEAKEREEAARMARLKADVRYSQHHVEHAHGSRPESATQRRKSLRMLFGKHKGKKVAEVPTGYLEWMLSGAIKFGRSQQWYKDAIAAEVLSRRNKNQSQPAPPRHPVDANSLDAELLLL
jgi:superfamily II DNA or RNA helicase